MSQSIYINNETAVQRLNQAELYYKRSPGLQTRDGIKLIDKLLIAKGSTVLDLGCGTGNLTSVLAYKVGASGHVIGIDPDRERIKVAKENILKSNITFLEADGETFPGNQYDLVFTNYVLHWIEDKDAVFKRVSKFLCPGGKFAFLVTQAFPPLYNEFLALMDQEKAKALPQKMFCVSESELEALGANNGFNVDYKEVGVSRLLFLSFDCALEFLYTTASGYFDIASIDKRALEGIRSKYANRTFEFTEEYAMYILVKE